MHYFFIALLGSFFIVPLSARALDDGDAAAKAFEKGINAYNKDDYETAASYFRKANELSFSWKILYNIGQSEAAAKRNGLALQAFEEYLTRAGDDISQTRRDEVVSEIRRLKLIVGMLEVDAPKGAIVFVDGEKRDTLPLLGPVMISAGIAHEVVIELDGKTLHRQKIRVSGGHTQKIVATLRDQSGPPSTKPSPSDSLLSDVSDDDGNAPSGGDTSSPAADRRAAPLAGPLLMAGGGAIAVAGLAVGGVAWKQGVDLDDAYPNGVPSTKRDEVDRVNHMALAADILIPVGAAACVTGFVIWMIQRRKGKKEPAASPVSLVAPGMLGAGLSGQF